MNNRDKINKIINVLESAGWEVTECNFQHRSADFRKGYMEIQVSFEECYCHGGRISVAEKGHNNQCFRIEHECYDPEKGIVDGETELLWEIDNELLDVVRQFDHYTYKACVINQYGQKNGRDDVVNTYHKSLDDAFYAISATVADPLTFEKGVHDYPNPKCHLRVTRIHKQEEHSWERNRIWFALEYTTDDWETSSKYEAYLSIFDKSR